MLAEGAGELDEGDEQAAAGGVQSLVEMLKSLGKVGIVSGVVYSAIGAAMPEALNLGQSAPSELLPMVKHYSLRLLTSAGVAYVVLAAAARHVHEIARAEGVGDAVDGDGARSADVEHTHLAALAEVVGLEIG